MGFNNGPSIIQTGLDLLVDAADPTSYPGSGTVWTDLRLGTTGSLTGSVSYTSEYYGGLTFTDSSSAVIFPGSTANYGTGSFTVEMAFKPDYIEGRHYLMSKNSGSFPNWAIYLSGSSGQGKLWSEFNIDASVSCSISSSTTFETGSIYQVDVKIAPGLSGSGITINGQVDAGGVGNGAGSLANTGSLFVGNYSQDNTQNFSGSLFTVKTYDIVSFTQPVQNFNATATRLSKNPSAVAPAFELLVVAGGGSGGGYYSGGGGAGGLQYISNYTPSVGVSQVTVGSGASTIKGFGGTGGRGENSTFAGLISIGGGGGGDAATTGGSGGGGAGWSSPPYPGAAGTPNQGNAGGDGTVAGSGGGGGAGTPGITGAGTVGGSGGSGSYIASFAAIGGSPAGWFAGGGGGLYGSSNGGTGGIGGGGDGGRTGSANTGGGGGAVFSGTAIGGSGIVAVRYSGAPIAVGGEITQSEGYTYHVFRTVGTSSFTIF